MKGMDAEKPFEQEQEGLFLGLCGLDVVHYFSAMPNPKDGKNKSTAHRLAIGGPAANAAIQYAALGGSACLAAVVGDTPLGVLIKTMLAQHNVRLVDLAATPDVLPSVSSIFVDGEGARYIASGQTRVSRLQNLPKLPNARFVLYDCNLGAYGNNVLAEQKQKRVPIVLDAGSYKPDSDTTLQLADVVISSQTFADPKGNDIFALLGQNDKVCLAKTQGGDDILVQAEGETGRIPVEKVANPVDTLGAGDVLHGAFCYYYFNQNQGFWEALKRASELATASTQKRGIL